MRLRWEKRSNRDLRALEYALERTVLRNDDIPVETARPCPANYVEQSLLGTVEITRRLDRSYPHKGGFFESDASLRCDFHLSTEAQRPLYART